MTGSDKERPRSRRAATDIAHAASARSATPWQPEGPTIRLHIGLEDVGDLKADLEAGFERLVAATR